MLGLRLDEPLPLAGLESVVDRAALGRMVEGGLAIAEPGPTGEETLTLTPRGRFLGDAVTAELLVLGTGCPGGRDGGGRYDRRMDASVPFVPASFEPPTSLVTAAFTLEPLGPRHNESDYAAWSSSIAHIQATPGFPWGSWPHEMSLAENLADLEMHERHFATRVGFTYTVLDPESGDVIGCVYIYPVRGGEATARPSRARARRPSAPGCGPTGHRSTSRSGARSAPGSRRTGRSSESCTRLATDGRAARQPCGRGAAPRYDQTPWNSSPPAGARSCGGWSRSTSPPASPSGRNRSSSGRAWTCRRRPCGASWPSSRRSGC